MNFVFIVGEPGTGKTTYARALIDAHRHPRRQFVVLGRGFRGTPVGTVADLYRRGSMPPVALLDSGETLEDAARFCIWRGSITLVCDELHEHVRRGERLAKGSALYEVLHKGLHHRVALIALTQNPYDASYDVTSMAGTVVFFRLTDQTALGWAQSRCGSRRVAEQVRGLRGYLPLRWQSGKGLLDTPAQEEPAP